jgi:uncharacterized membrane protein YbhN (UPF0104 family)
LGDLRTLHLAGRDQLIASLVYAAVWAAWGCAFYLVCLQFVTLSPRLMPLVVFWFVAGYVIGFVSSIAPAGLGVREGLIVLGLSGAMPAGEAVALALAGRIWMTLVELVWVGIAWRIPMPRDTEPPVR